MIIEERAEAFAISISPYPQDKGATFDTDTKIAYIKGAAEQKAIDIDKACKWFKKYCGMNDSGLVQFRKMMEGEK